MLFLFACSEPDDAPVTLRPPELSVSGTLSFGTLDAGEEGTRTAWVNNDGGSTEVTLSVDLPDVFSLPDGSSLTMDAHDRANVAIRAVGTGDLERGTLRLEAPDSDVLEVPLVVGGVDRTLAASPDALDFGWVAQGDSREIALTLTATGSADVDVDTLSVDDDAFAVHGAEPPLTVPDGATQTLVVAFAPDDAADHPATLTVDGPGMDAPLEVSLSGSSAMDRPVALCRAKPEEVLLGDTARFVDAGSFDPGGLAPLLSTWTLTDAPAGSTATLLPVESAASITPALPGTYTATLVVENTEGVVSQAYTASLEVTAQLVFTLTWAHAGDDLDLHLVKPGGALRTDGDCYVADCRGDGVDWGAVLSEDDRKGTGPEILTLTDGPVGTYTVYVHDHPDSVYEGNDAATVEVSVGGVVLASRTIEVTGEDAYVPFFEVTLPTLGIVEP